VPCCTVLHRAVLCCAARRYASERVEAELNEKRANIDALRAANSLLKEKRASDRQAALTLGAVQPYPRGRSHLGPVPLRASPTLGAYSPRYRLADVARGAISVARSRLHVACRPLHGVRRLLHGVVCGCIAAQELRATKERLVSVQLLQQQVAFSVPAPPPPKRIRFLPPASTAVAPKPSAVAARSDPIRSAPRRCGARLRRAAGGMERNGMGLDCRARRRSVRYKRGAPRSPCLSRSARCVRAVAPIERKGILQSDADSDASVWRDGGLCGTALLPDDEHVACRMLQLGGAEGGDE
jgi:hypothetical protein